MPLPSLHKAVDTCEAGMEGFQNARSTCQEAKSNVRQFMKDNGCASVLQSENRLWLGLILSGALFLGLLGVTRPKHSFDLVPGQTVQVPNASTIPWITTSRLRVMPSSNQGTTNIYTLNECPQVSYDNSIQIYNQETIELSTSSSLSASSYHYELYRLLEGSSLTSSATITAVNNESNEQMTVRQVLSQGRELDSSVHQWEHELKWDSATTNHVEVVSFAATSGTQNQVQSTVTQSGLYIMSYELLSESSGANNSTGPSSGSSSSSSVTLQVDTTLVATTYNLQDYSADCTVGSNDKKACDMDRANCVILQAVNDNGNDDDGNNNQQAARSVLVYTHREWLHILLISMIPLVCLGLCCRGGKSTSDKSSSSGNHCGGGWCCCPNLFSSSKSSNNRSMGGDDDDSAYQQWQDGTSPAAVAPVTHGYTLNGQDPDSYTEAHVVAAHTGNLPSAPMEEDDRSSESLPVVTGVVV